MGGIIGAGEAPNWTGIIAALGHPGVTWDADPGPPRDGLGGVFVVGRAGRFCQGTMALRVWKSVVSGMFLGFGSSGLKSSVIYRSETSLSEHDL